MPPVKSAGKSALDDFSITIFFMRFVGKISIWRVFLSGSSPGMSNPFKIVFVYLSPKPLTKTYFPPWIETPGTLFIAAAASLSPIFLKFSAVIPSRRFGDFLCTERSADSLSAITAAVTTTPSSNSDSYSRLAERG